MRPADMDRRIWVTVDGHAFRSVPTSVPQKWTPREVRSVTFGLLLVCYVSGEYEIRRRHGGIVKYSYDLYRSGIKVGFTMTRLKDAKASAVRNARGEDRVNVA